MAANVPSRVIRASWFDVFISLMVAFYVFDVALSIGRSVIWVTLISVLSSCR